MDTGYIASLIAGGIAVVVLTTAGLLIGRRNQWAHLAFIVAWGAVAVTALVVVS